MPLTAIALAELASLPGDEPVIMSPAQRKALTKAASRERGSVCPIVGVHAHAETLILQALERRGLIFWDGGHCPRISDAGRKAIESHRAWLARRTAELEGREPVAVSDEHPFDGRAFNLKGN